VIYHCDNGLPIAFLKRNDRQVIDFIAPPEG
jgi:hypothetical protein